MKNKLSIGEVSYLFNVSKDTLRYFDKANIVVAKKDKNGYRYYDDWDINYLLEYKRYRGYEYNVEETKEILHNDSLEDLMMKYNGNQLILEKKLKLYEELVKRNQKYLDNLNNLDQKLNKIIIKDYYQKLYYFPNRYNNSYLYKDDVAFMLSHWTKHFPFVDSIFIINNIDSEYYEVGMAVNEEYQQFLHLPINHLCKTLEIHKALNTIIVTGGKNTFSLHLFDDVFHYMKEHHLEMAGPLIGYYLARVHEDNEYKRYLEIFIPLK